MSQIQPTPNVFPKPSLKPPRSLPRGLARISEAKDQLREIYLALLKIEIGFNPFCRRCKRNKATEGHHPFGQLGILILIFFPFCRRCHDDVHQHADQARVDGWIRDHKP